MEGEKYKTLAESSNGRWWEFYFVRYAMGTIVGSFMVFYLLNNVKNEFTSKTLELLNLKDYGLLVLPILGISFCYLSSAPVLVLHACRSAIKDIDEKSMLCNLTVYAIVFVIMLYVAFLLIPAFATSIILLIIFLIMQISYIHSSIKNRNNFYEVLCQKRADATDSCKEYIESYKHLREHGNAFMIVIMEVVLAVILYGIDSADYLLAAILIWVFPAAYVWFIGSYLEKNLIEK